MPNVTQHAKKLKMSHFHSIAEEKQPTRAMQMPTVPEFSHIIVIGNLPAHVFSFNNNVFMLPAKANWCQTSKKGGESRLFKFSLEQTPALQALADVDIGCNGNLSPPYGLWEAGVPMSGLRVGVGREHLSR